MSERLTMVIAGGGSPNTMIMLANHTFLSDSAYARKAEKTVQHDNVPELSCGL